MESTLSLKRSDLIDRVALFLGWETVEARRTTRDQALLQAFVDTGLRRFYSPPPVPPSNTPHDWSFLKPVATLVIPEGVQSVPLPDDYGSMDGQISVLAPDGASTQCSWPIPQVGIGQIHQKYSELPTAAGRPLYAAVSPKKVTGPARGQRFDLWVYPLTDAEYTFQFQYYLLPDALTAENPYYYGGMAHSDTVMESCLLAAENMLDDVPLLSCVHYTTFMSFLAASVHTDSRAKPKLLGFNRDYSDMAPARGRGWRNWPTISFNGTEY